MAVAKKDANRVPSLIGVSSADGSTPTRIYVDPTTNRLYVDVALSGVTDLTGVTDGEAVNAADKGVLLMGTDGSNYQVAATDSSGNLQVDVLNASLAVTGTFWQATQPVSGTFYQATQPVSIAGTVAVDMADEATRLVGVVYGSQGAQLQQKITSNDLIITLDGEATVLGTGAASIGTLGSNSGVDIGDVTINNASGASAVNIQDGGNSITVDGTVTVNAGTGTFTVGATDLDIRNLTSASDLVAVLQATASNLNAQVVGAAAHDAVAWGNPIINAASAETAEDAAPANRVSADADVVRLSADRDGALYVHPHGPQIWSYHENSSSVLTDVTVHAAAGVGLSLCVTDIVCSTGAATAMNIFFEEGVTTVLGPYYLEAVAGRGFSFHFQTPKKLTANTALTITSSTTILHSIEVLGFISP